MADWRAELSRHLDDGARVEELAQHLEALHDELLAAGSPPDEAEVAVRAELEEVAGAVRAVTPQAKAPLITGAPRRNFLADVAHDLRYAVRALARSRGATVAMLLSLALGIGANTALFLLVDALQLRSLPVARPDELARVNIANRADHSGREAGVHAGLTEPMYLRLRETQQAFTGMAAFVDADANLSPSGEAKNRRVLFASGGFFGVMGVGPAQGRLLAVADDAPGCTVAVASHGFWQRDLGGAADALGRSVILDGRPFTLVGVTPPGFTGPEVGKAFDVAVPLCALPFRREPDISNVFFLTVLARLKPGWSIAEASAHLAAISPAIMLVTTPTHFDAEHAAIFHGYRLAATPGGAGVSKLREDYSERLHLLLAIAALVLLVACANLANLLLARARAREREIAVRLALGASRGRLFRQLMTESFLLAGSGAALGLVIGRLLGEGLIFLFSPRGELVTLPLDADGRVLAFTAGLAFLTCLLFGLAPALRAARTDVQLTLRASAPQSSGRHRGIRELLVGVQVALSFVLLVFALLFVRTLRNLTTLDPGFQKTGVLSLGVDWPPGARPLDRDLFSRLRELPGVAAVSTTNILPAGNWTHAFPSVWLDGHERPPSDHTVVTSRVSPGYFDTVGTPLLAGRDFRDGDGDRLAIVNEQFARVFTGGANPVGQRFRTPDEHGGPENVYEVVGLAHDSKYRNLREDFGPIAFLSAPETTGQTVLVRGDLPRGELSAAAVRIVTDLAPEAVYSLDFLDEVVADSIHRERVMALLAGAFGVLAVVLAAVGLYGVVSYSVVSRTHEIGIRMALGADRARVSRMIVAETARTVAAGLLAGGLVTFWATRLARTLLYGLAPEDPLTFAMAVALMTLVALAACVLPARRASSVDPMVALRAE